MAPKLSLASSPCLFCRAALHTSRLAIRTPVAYKSTVRNENRKNSKTDFTVIQLLKPVDAYGDAETFLEVPRGTMRRQLHAKQLARYVVADELKQLRVQDAIVERNRSFKTLRSETDTTKSKVVQRIDGVSMAEAAEMLQDAAKRQQEAAEAAALLEEETRRQQDKQAEQERKSKLIERALPKLQDVIRPSYIFQQSVNTASAQIDKSGNWKTGTPIFGSVTIADILARIRDSLSKDVDTATLAIDETNILIVSGTEDAEPDRLKALGAFKVQISIPGSTTEIMTTVEILPDQSSDDALGEAREVARKAVRPIMPKENAASAFAKQGKPGSTSGQRPRS